MTRSVSVTIIGKVQNVGFRYYTRKMAQSLSVNGFVKNLSDGSVYTEAEGSSADIELFIEYCKKGPEWSRVEEINIQEIPFQDHIGFSAK